MSRSSRGPRRSDALPSPGDSDGDLAAEARLAASAEHHLADGVDLLRWWSLASHGRSPLIRFPLAAPGRSYGFFGTARVGGRDLPVMGNYQELDYDLPKAPPQDRRAASEWLRAQVREFVLRYFLRVSGTSAPHAEARSVPGGVGRGGFVFRQRLISRSPGPGRTGGIERTSGARSRAFVDLRRLGRDIDWVLARLHIRDFGFEVRPFGELGPRLGMPFRGQSHLVFGAPLIVDLTHPSDDRLGCYGLGYAFARDPEPGLLAYGPGELDAAIELIRFHVLATGLVKVTMLFVSNRPERLLDRRVAPVEWGARMMNLASFGLGSHLRRRLTLALQREFLERHCLQHHEALAGTLHTWRQVPDWLDTDSLPTWVPRDGGASGATPERSP